MSKPVLSRDIGTFGAVMLGLGSIIGTGVFVSIGIAAGVAGSFLLLSIVIAGLLAVCNGLSSAQLAANYPVSGGTYEYGRKYLNPFLGFLAGWVFICAKSASAATAALGFAGYLSAILNLNVNSFSIIGAVVLTIFLTIIILLGISRTSKINILIVSITILSLAVFIIFGFFNIYENSKINFVEAFTSKSQNNSSINSIFFATSLMFVAFTGYGRIATLGEEVKKPRIVIPKAIVISLIVSAVLYIAVAFIGMKVLGSKQFSVASQEYIAPLVFISKSFNVRGIELIISVGAITAMAGVLLNLLLGVSRVIFAMGRSGDMPSFVSNLKGTTPTFASVIAGLVVAALVLIGNVKTTWSLSAFTVLLYYSITNLAALKLSEEESLFPRWIAIIGFAACLIISFYIETEIFIKGLGLIFLGVLWYFLFGFLKIRRL